MIQETSFEIRNKSTISSVMFVETKFAEIKLMKMIFFIFLAVLFLGGCTVSAYIGTECKAGEPWGHLKDGPKNKNELLDQITALPESGHYLGKHLEWYEDDDGRIMACFHAGESCTSARLYFEDRKLEEVGPVTECQSPDN